MNFETRYLSKFIKWIDCNDCAYLNMTEEEQEYKGRGMHKCLFYDKRVIHGTNNRIHSEMIHPCNECEKDEHKHFIERSTRRCENCSRFNEETNSCGKYVNTCMQNYNAYSNWL